jgi:hypothetical protein
MPVTTGLILQLKVTGQDTQINLADVQAVMYGAAEFRLQIPAGGFVLQMQAVLDFLSKQLNYDTTNLPAPILNTLKETQIILNEFRYRQPKWVYDEGTKVWKAPADGNGKPIPADFRFSMTVSFNRDGHGGLLTDLIGVDVTPIIDIEAFTVILSTDLFKDAESPPPPPPSSGTTKATDSDKPGDAPKK